MAYDKNKIFEQAKEVTVKHKLFFIEDIVAFLPCSKNYFYDHFPPDSNEYDELKGLLETNRTTLKVSMRSKWYTSNAPALQMALMKLIATPEELRKLSMQTNALEGEITSNVISLGSGIKPNETTS
jgi:hypothetical protein